MVNGDREPDLDDGSVIEIWARTAPRTALVVFATVFGVVASAVAFVLRTTSPGVGGELLMFFVGALSALLVFLSILVRRRANVEPIAWYDPRTEHLTTLSASRVERQWPRYRGEGQLIADDDEILLERPNGVRQVVIRRAAVEAAGFNELHDLLRASEARD